MSAKDRTAIAAQADIDTPASVPSYGVPLETDSIDLNRNEITTSETLGDRGTDTSEYGLRFAEGNMNGHCRPASFPLVLAAFMGAPTSALVTTGVYTHTYDPLTMTDVVPLTVWGINNDPRYTQAGTLEANPIVTEFDGAKGNQLTLSAEVDNYVNFESTFAAKSMSAAVEAAPSITTDIGRKWVFKEVLAELAVGSISGVAEVYAGSFSFVFNNNLITDLGRLGSNELTDIPLGPKIESTLTVRFQRDIASHYLRALEDSPAQVSMKLTAVGSTIASTHKYTLSLEFPYLETQSAPLERSGGDTLRDIETTFRVVKDPTTGKMVTPVIKNASSGTLYVG